ncbi:MAG: hypothetical protein ABI661_07145, partial [Gammaproteobacteria bacterium]
LALPVSRSIFRASWSSEGNVTIDSTSQPASESADVAALVARYAPVGRQLRRRRRLTRIALALLVPVLGLGALLIYQSRDAILARMMSGSDSRVARTLNEVRDIRASLQAETGALVAQQAELARQQEVFRQKTDELALRLGAIDKQRQALADQSRLFEEQRRALNRDIEKADRDSRKLQASSGGQSSVDRQLREVKQQRMALEDQRRQFRDEGKVLARKLAEINLQRGEIEQQRESIQEQQAEVRRLLERVKPVDVRREPGQLPSGDAAALDQPRAQLRPAPPAASRTLVSGGIATLAAVEPAVLAGMRGGLDLGPDYSFAIGITRSTSINGIEQFSSAMYINELGQATGTGTSTQSIQLGEPMVIQNGPGNFVDAGALANMGLSSPTIIQNTLDNQTISNKLVLDVSLHNVSSLVQGMDLSRIARDGQTLPH